MKILALDLSSGRGSIAFQGEDVDLVEEWPNDRKNSSAFFEQIEKVLKQHGHPERIIVGLGPGSYAGTRIAISTAIGLSFAGGTGSVPSQNLGRHGGRPSIELIGLPSICAMDSNEYCVIGDARRQSFFFAQIRENELSEGPTLLSETELRDKIDMLPMEMSIFATEKLPQFERAQTRYPVARILARLAQDTKRSFVMPPLEPMYLREPHITTPKLIARST